jgi:hypothetical protein
MLMVLVLFARVVPLNHCHLSMQSGLPTAPSRPVTPDLDASHNRKVNGRLITYLYGLPFLARRPSLHGDRFRGEIQPMNQMEQMDQHNCRVSARRRWLFVCFLTLIALVLSFGPSLPTHTNSPEPQYVTAGSGGDSDCDRTHDGLGLHCHATAAGAAYARTESGPAILGDIARGYPMSIAESDRTSRTLRPNLQPPQRLHQA